MWRVHALAQGNLHEVGMLSQADSTTNESTERLDWGSSAEWAMEGADEESETQELSHTAVVCEGCRGKRAVPAFF